MTQNHRRRHLENTIMNPETQESEQAKQVLLKVKITVRGFMHEKAKLWDEHMQQRFKNWYIDESKERFPKQSAPRQMSITEYCQTLENVQWHCNASIRRFRAKTQSITWAPATEEPIYLGYEFSMKYINFYMKTKAPFVHLRGDIPQNRSEMFVVAFDQITKLGDGEVRLVQESVLCIRRGVCIGSLVSRYAKLDEYVENGLLIFVDRATQDLWIVNPAEQHEDLGEMVPVDGMVGVKNFLPLMDSGNELDERNAYRLKVSIADLSNIRDDQRFLQLFDTNLPECHVRMRPAPKEMAPGGEEKI